jgi:hypothetical protein
MKELRTIIEIEAEIVALKEDLKVVTSKAVIYDVNERLSKLKALHHKMTEKMKNFDFIAAEQISKQKNIEILSCDFEKILSRTDFPYRISAKVSVDGLAVGVCYELNEFNADTSDKDAVFEAVKANIEKLFN